MSKYLYEIKNTNKTKYFRSNENNVVHLYKGFKMTDERKLEIIHDILHTYITCLKRKDIELDDKFDYHFGRFIRNSFGDEFKAVLEEQKRVEKLLGAKNDN